MKIIYVNCGVKNYLTEGHRSCKCNLCMQLRKESLKTNSGRKRGSRKPYKKFSLLQDSNPFDLCFVGRQRSTN